MIFKDRVKQYTNTIGTDDYSLSGSFSGYDTFADSFDDGDITCVCVTDGSQYEVVIGALSASGLLFSRDDIQASTNSNNKVVWTAGNKTIFCTLSASLVTTYDNGAPAIDRNPAYSGAQYIDLDSGILYSCIDNTVDNNNWKSATGLTETEVEAISIALVIALG